MWVPRPAPPPPAPTCPRRSAQLLKRIHRDLADFEREPLPCMSIAPQQDRATTLHANICASEGPLRGVPFHLVIEVGADYPSAPPDVKMCTTFAHPNVFRGGWICLDMLKPHTSTTPYEGWSSAYTLKAILLQLQSFLFAERIPQDYGPDMPSRMHESAAYYITEALDFRCDACGHHGRTAPTPPIEHMPPAEQEQDQPPAPPAGPRLVGLGVATSRNGLTAQSYSGSWATASLSRGLSAGLAVFEAVLLPPAGQRHPAVGFARVGWGTAAAGELGGDAHSVGFESTGQLWHARRGSTFGDTFRPHFTVTTAVDLVGGWAYFALNGVPQRPRFRLPREWQGQEVFPMVALKNMTVRVAVGAPRYPLDGVAALPLAVALRRAEAAAAAPPAADDTPTQPAAPALSDYLVRHIFELAGADNGKGVCRQWARVWFENSYVDRAALRCFHWKTALDDEDERPVLGVLVNMDSMDQQGRIRDMSASMDLLSWEAFERGCVRQSVWSESFRYFLPLALDAVHAQRAGDLFERCVARIARDESPPPAFRPEHALEVLPALMNSLVVGLMNASHSRQHSEKALLGYVSCHHLLLLLAERHPEVAALATRRVRQFVRDPQRRHKQHAPNLGTLLVLMTIVEPSDVAWADLAMPFLFEVFDRNVRWSLKSHGHLARDVSDGVRLRDTFEATGTSRQLVMFQVLFLTTLGIRRGETRAQALRRYDARLGQPSEAQHAALVAACREIRAVKRWDEFFRRVQVKTPSPAQLAGVLRAAIENSERKGYHTSGGRGGGGYGGGGCGGGRRRGRRR